MEQLLGSDRNNPNRTQELMDKYLERTMNIKERIEMLVRLSYDAENDREAEFMINVLAKTLSDCTRQQVINTLQEWEDRP